MCAYPEVHMTNYNFILSGRYQLIRSLGRGSDSTVYLARHTSLEREYAIKVYPKSTLHSLSAITEARLLQSLHHVSIPFVHDIEEDDTNYYLVEEYVPGESLEEFLSHQQPISQNIFYSICEQLCDVFIYLHSHTPDPLFYQDLKPEHIIVCEFQIKLIDFGSSYSITSSGKNFNYYGNKEFSAPEYLSGGALSVSADIYSLGKMLGYIAHFAESGISAKIAYIINKATASDPMLRYETVEALWTEIRTLQNSQTYKPHLLRTVAVVGNTRGCGTTHISIALVSTLNALGIDAFYYEKNQNNSMRKMFSMMKQMVEKPDGYYVYRSFKGYPEYGTGIRISPPQSAIAIKDYGTDWTSSNLSDCDLILYICDNAFWNRHETVEKATILRRHSIPILYICNLGSHKNALYLARQFSKPIHLYPYDTNPFDVTAEKKKIVKRILPSILKRKGNLICSVAKKITRQLSKK